MLIFDIFEPWLLYYYLDYQCTKIQPYTSDEKKKRFCTIHDFGPTTFLSSCNQECVK